LEVLFCSGGGFSASVQVVDVGRKFFLSCEFLFRGGSNFVVVLVRFKNAFSRHKPSPVAT
jgi:hypothetical protein